MKPNVLQLVGSFYEGGSERQALQLARLLKDSGRFCVHIACLDGNGALRAEAERLGEGTIPEYPLNCFYDRNMLLQLRRFVHLLKERDIALVHSHDFYTNVFGMLGAKLAGVPIRIASRRESAKRPALHRWVERGAYRIANAVVANCADVRRQLVQEGVAADKVVTIYNGLDLARVTPHMPRMKALSLFDLDSQEGHPFVTIVANMRNEMKDYPMFLRAAQQVAAALPDVRFILAGEGPLMASFRRLTDQLGLNQHVHFIGRCTKIAELLSISDVCVLSSKSEGFSNAILEYMAASRPVVATDVGGAREVVEEDKTGYLVRVGDDTGMAERILALLSDPKKAHEMGKFGRCAVENRFSTTAQFENTCRLYARLLSYSVHPSKAAEDESERAQRGIL